MSEKITVYEKPTCSTCRQMDQRLRESGVDYEKINYYVQPLSEKKLRELLSKMNITARELLRTKDALYKELDLGASKHTEDQLIKLMAKHPDLIQRPIVEKGARAILGRPITNVEALLKRK